MPSPPVYLSVSHQKRVQLYSVLPSRGSFTNAKRHFELMMTEFSQTQIKEVLWVVVMVWIRVRVWVRVMIGLVLRARDRVGVRVRGRVRASVQVRVRVRVLVSRVLVSRVLGSGLGF